MNDNELLLMLRNNELTKAVVSLAVDEQACIQQDARVLQSSVYFLGWLNFFLSSWLLFGDFIPFELQLAVFHLFFMNFAMFFQMITT